MNAVPSKCLGGEGYLQQYFKGFIKLLAVTEKISVVKNTYLFPLSCRCLTGSVLGGVSLCPHFCSQVWFLSWFFLKLLVNRGKSLWLKVCLLFNQVKECLEVQSPEPTRLISSPGATTLVCCVTLGKFADLSASDSRFCTAEMMVEHTRWRNGKLQRDIHTKHSELGPW